MDAAGAAPATPVRDAREAFALATKHAGCVALLPLLRAVWTQWSHILPFMDAADDDLDAGKIRANGASVAAVMVKLVEEDDKAEDADKVLRSDVEERKVQVSALARALKYLYQNEERLTRVDSARSTGRSVRSVAPSVAGTPASAVELAAPGSAARAKVAMEQVLWLETVETQLGVRISENAMPRADLISRVAEAWNTTKPRMVTFAEVVTLCGPREAACDFVPGGKAELRATRVSADFLRYLLALAVGTSAKLVAGAALAKHAVLDGGTGLPDAAHVVGLKATMALVVHTRYALAIRNATFHQAYELRARVAEHASRLQSPSSSSAISITAAFAGVLDADSLRLLSHEDAKATVPASVIDAGTSDEAKKDTAKSDTKKAETKGDVKKPQGKGKKGKGGKGTGRWQSSRADYREDNGRRRPRSRSPEDRRRSRTPDREPYRGRNQKQADRRR